MRIFHLLVLCIATNFALAQSIVTSQNQINFGNTFDNSPDSVQLTITNAGNALVNVTGIKFYLVYGSNPFSVSDSLFSLSPAASKIIWVKFSPLHNVAHNVEMVILNDSHRGNVSVDLRGQGKYSKTYYANTENLVEQVLKDTLQAITGRGYIQLGYNNARDKMFMNVDNKKNNGQGAASNTLECVYTGRNAVGYTNRSNCQTAYNFNTEHTYPQNYFGSVEPMLSDLFHLFPTDITANSTRGSFRFGVVTGTPTWTDGGSKFGGVFFEPRDVHKGQVARSMFYFVIRYQNFQGFLTTQETTLREWLHSFPPSAIEKKRNTDIFSFQKNYNPFIDYPQLVDRITSISNPSSAPVLAMIDQTDSIIDFGFVPAGVPTTYSLVLVNKGNSIVNFSNFNFSNPGILSFVAGSGTNTSLLPGEALALKINLSTLSSDSLFEYLNFNTDVPNAPSIQVPIFANFYQLPLNILSKNVVNPEFSLLPNPSAGTVNLSYDLKQGSQPTLSVFDLLGNRVFVQNLSSESRSEQINLSHLSAGIYSCLLQTTFGSEMKKLVLVKQ